MVDEQASCIYRDTDGRLRVLWLHAEEPTVLQYITAMVIKPGFSSSQKRMLLAELSSCR
jgi:hypothetical protein